MHEEVVLLPGEIDTLIQSKDVLKSKIQVKEKKRGTMANHMEGEIEI